ncbi:NmrA family transcriptional regulator [Algoriphagus lacus]|uniref:NmrA family transcriptional regulator n=1 Tax=Algoriphagus lacus TaxID=2056311 RepID=A0A418PQU5_9BACT|nr:NmrA family NAD(P)-binding protein [Algoriphagus lacus]RIW14966.1 NmrA family transcriptional regulator [Algoriphagus lacus]
MKVLVYGAGGSQQFPVIKALTDRGAKVLATTNQPEKIDLLTKAGAETVLANMSDKERLVEITKGIDAISFLVPFFLANPLDGYEYAKNAIDAAVKNNVKLLVWNTSGYILPIKIGNPAMDVRIDIADYLKNSGIPNIIIQPSVYAENLLGPWTAPFVKNDDTVTYPTPEEMPIGWIATKDVAQFVAQAIYSPHLAGQSFQISGVENLTGRQLANKFSIALNKPVQYRQMPPREFGKILEGLFGEGAGKGAEKMYQEITDTKQYPIMHSHSLSEVLEKLPVKMTSIEEWVSQNIESFS